MTMDDQGEWERFRVLMRRSAWVLRATAVLLVLSGAGGSGGDWASAWPWYLGALVLVIGSFFVANLGRAD